MGLIVSEVMVTGHVIMKHSERIKHLYQELCVRGLAQW